MKVDILIPSYRQARASARQAIQAMVNHTREKGVDVFEPALHAHGLIHLARNHALGSIRKTASYVLFCDDDMVPQKDSLLRLLGHRAQVVSALTTTKELPPRIVVAAYDAERDIFCDIESVKPDALIGADQRISAGTGFLLIKKPVIDEMVEYHLSGSDWVDQHAAQHARMGVQPEAIETERKRISTTRRHLVKDGVAPRVFDFDENGAYVQLGEDHTFSRRLIRKGIPILCDTSVWVGHLGDFPYGPWNLFDKSPTDIKLHDH